MRAVLCGANGAMGKLIDGQLPQEVAGRVSLDGENGVARTFAQLGPVEADVVMDFSHHSAISDVLAYAKGIGAAAVIGTPVIPRQKRRKFWQLPRRFPCFIPEI